MLNAQFFTIILYLYSNTKFLLYVLQVSIVGDFTEDEVESCILDYLGTAQATRNYTKEQEFYPPSFRLSPSNLLQSQEVS